MPPAAADLAFDLADEAATRRLGAALAELARPGDVICLKGGLGAGKTTLARGFVQTLTTADEEVVSPTFTLVQIYEATVYAPGATIWHFDLYRLRRPEEALELGLEEALAEGIVLIEWPERLGGFLPTRRLEVTLALGLQSGRQAALSGGPAWAPRLEMLRTTKGPDVR